MILYLLHRKIIIALLNTTKFICHYYSHLNPKYALENLLRVKSTSNQHFLKFEKRSSAMILKFKEMIYCIFNSHNEVLTRILG